MAKVPRLYLMHARRICRGKVGDGEERVRRRLHENRLHVRRDRRIERGRIVGVRKRVTESELLENLVEDAEGR